MNRAFALLAGLLALASCTLRISSSDTAEDLPDRFEVVSATDLRGDVTHQVLVLRDNASGQCFGAFYTYYGVANLGPVPCDYSEAVP